MNMVLVELQSLDPVLNGHLLAASHQNKIETFANVCHVGPRLFTATLEVRQSEELLSVFHACHAVTEIEVIEALARRMPSSLLAFVEVRHGIDPADAVVCRLVPSGTLEWLVTIGDCCPLKRPLASGGALHIVEKAG